MRSEPTRSAPACVHNIKAMAMRPLGINGAPMGVSRKCDQYQSGETLSNVQQVFDTARVLGIVFSIELAMGKGRFTLANTLKPQ